MRIILCLIGLVLSLTIFGQNQTLTNLRIRESLRVGDSTATIIGSDTLTNKKMVRQLISEGGGYTASNGLSKVGSDFRLGSPNPLSEDVEIPGGSYKFKIGLSSSLIEEFDVRAQGDINLSTEQLNIIVPGYEWNFLGKTIEGLDGDIIAYESYVRSYNLSQQKAAPFVFLYENLGVTANIRPGSGFYSTNNATASLITEIYIDDFDQNTVAKQQFLQIADTGSYFYIQEKGVTTAFYMYQIESFADSAGWTVYNVEYVFNTGNIAETDDIELVLEINNITGGGGGGTVDTFYVAGQNEWVFSGDTIRKVDTSNVSKKLVTDVVTIDDLGVDGTDLAFNMENSAGTGKIYGITKEFSNDRFYGELNSVSGTFKNQFNFNHDYVGFLLNDTGDAYYRPIFQMNTGIPYIRAYVHDGTVDHLDGIEINGTDKYTGIIAEHGNYESIYKFDTNSVDFIIDLVTKYSFEEDTMKAADIVAQFQELNSVRSISDTFKITGQTGEHYITDNGDNSLKLVRNSGLDHLTIGGDESDGVSLYSSGDAIIAGGVRVALNSNGSLYDFISDTLFAEEEAAKFKYIEATEIVSEKATLDTSIIGGDTITGAVELKAAVEAEQFAQLNFKDTSFTTHSEGRLFYDEHEKAFSAFNDIVGFKEELGRGINVQFYNNTGGTINNGTLIRSLGSKVNGAISFTADLAGNGSLDSLQGVAMVTADVLTGNFGMATLIGQVNGLNTSAFNDNDLLWVGSEGTYVDTIPPPPYYASLFGRIVYADADSGAIYIFPVGEVKYNPEPNSSFSFTRETETITNTGLDVPILISNATNDLYTNDLNIGFNFVGDTINPKQAGTYNISSAFAFQGDASTSDEWRIGIFKNGVELFSVLRTSSSSNKGVVSLSKTIELTTSDWISLRVINTTNATRSSVFTDGVININFR